MPVYGQLRIWKKYILSPFGLLSLRIYFLCVSMDIFDDFCVFYYFSLTDVKQFAILPDIYFLLLLVIIFMVCLYKTRRKLLWNIIKLYLKI